MLVSKLNNDHTGIDERKFCEFLFNRLLWGLPIDFHWLFINYPQLTVNYFIINYIVNNFIIILFFIDSYFIVYSFTNWHSIVSSVFLSGLFKFWIHIAIIIIINCISNDLLVFIPSVKHRQGTSTQKEGDGGREGKEQEEKEIIIININPCFKVNHCIGACSGQLLQ